VKEKHMYIIMGVHHPKPGMEKSLLEVQEKFGIAQRGHRGLISAFIWKDDKTDVIIGLALWDTKEDYDAARPDMDKALEGTDFRSLDSSMEIYRGSPAVWTA
jgi:hypothetical protein